MKGWREPLKKSRVSLWLFVLSYPIYLLVTLILDFLERLYVFLFRKAFPINFSDLYAWIMGICFFVSFISFISAFLSFTKVKQE